ncbi:uncharacterized protein LOC134266147 [Saccostrea cucullata]|uniref:uncharacterized protein LOC134266147 n=1 Tax=Saccostrea cuccullata TaxID=36930 RepID=UPI002ED0027C
MTWNNLTFTFIGCIGTLAIVGVTCYIKSWFIEMKFRTRRIQFEPSVFYHTGNANITTIQNMENMLNEGQEEGLIATGCRVLAERNKAMCDDAYLDPQTRNIYNDLNPNNVHKAEQNGVISRSSKLKEIVGHRVRDLQSGGAENIYCRIILGDEQPQRDDLDEDDENDNDENEGPRYEQPWSQMRNYDGNMKSHKIVRKDEEGHEKNIYESCKCSVRENEYSVEKSASPYSVYEREFIQGTTDHSDNYTCINRTSDETYTCMNKTSEENYTCINKTREKNNIKGGSSEQEEQKDRSA